MIVKLELDIKIKTISYEEYENVNITQEEFDTMIEKTRKILEKQTKEIVKNDFGLTNIEENKVKIKINATIVE